MAELNDFNTLADAKTHPVMTYRKIGGNEARQFFAMAGVLNSIESAQSSTTPCVDASNGINTTVGQLAKAVMQTIASGQFATDPNESDGQLNRLASAFMVANSVYPQAVEDAFFARAAETTYPFATATEYDFQKAKGTCPTKQVTPQNGWLKITTTADRPKHTPQIHAEIQGVMQRVAGFQNVEKAGDYIAQVPRGYTALYVDDAYGVIE